MDIDNFVHDLSLYDVENIIKYGLSINLGKLDYEIYKNSPGTMYRNISKDKLLDKLFALFKSIMDREEFIEKIQNRVKLVKTETVIIPVPFVSAFPKAKFCGKIEYSEDNINFMTDMEKNAGIYTTITTSRGGITNPSMVYRIASTDIDSHDYNLRVVESGINDLGDDGYFPSLEVLCLDYRDYVDEVKEFLDHNLDLPRLRAIKFCSGCRDYSCIDLILKKYPTITSIENFTVSHCDDVDIYEKYNHMIKKVYITDIFRYLSDHDFLMYNLISKLLITENKIRKGFVNPNKVISFNGYHPNKNHIIKLSQYFTTEYICVPKNSDLPNCETDFIKYLKYILGTPVENDRNIKIKVQLNINEYNDDILELAELTVAIFNK